MKSAEQRWYASCASAAARRVSRMRPHAMTLVNTARHVIKRILNRCFFI
jgi:hypothetical protein